jgi:dephospho-CoA kinase
MSTTDVTSPALIAVVGMAGTGKSSVAGFIEERYGLPTVYFGGITMQEVKRRGLAVTPDNERTVREQIRREHGMAAYAKLALPEIEAHLAKGNSVILDGLYSQSEFEFLTERFGSQLFLMAIVCDKALRYKRLSTRPVRPLTFDEVISRDLAEINQLEKGGPIAMADTFVLNNGEMAELKAGVLEKLVGRLG